MSLLRSIAVVSLVGLTAYAGYLIVRTDPAVELTGAEVLETPRSAIPTAPDPESSDRARWLLSRRPSVLDDPSEPVANESPPLPVHAGTVEQAQQGFDYVMGRIDELATRRRKLTAAEWDEVYRASNDAFAALSMHLDARDDGQREALDAAYRRLKNNLGRLRVRGKRR
jgi:hypothetical protein